MTWGAPLSRPTRDIDLLAQMANALGDTQIFQTICNRPVEPDGRVYDPGTVTGGVIKEHDKYQGVRIVFQGNQGTARADMQIDLGFADIVTPNPALVEYPVLLGYRDILVKLL